MARYVLLTLGSLAAFAGIQWWASTNDVSIILQQLDSGEAATEAVPLLRHPNLDRILRVHIQYVECEFNALAVARTDPDRNRSTLRRLWMPPNPDRSIFEEHFPICANWMWYAREVDHLGWRENPPAREKKRGTERWTTHARRQDRFRCLRGPPSVSSRQRYHWQEPEPCIEENIRRHCDRAVHKEKCRAYAEASLHDKPWKPRYWWGSQALWTIGLRHWNAQTLRSAGVVSVWTAWAILLMIAARRSKRAILVVCSAGVGAWVELRHPALFNWQSATACAWGILTGALALTCAGTRNMQPAMFLAGTVAAFLWLYQGQQVLGAGLILLMTYTALSRSSERQAAFAALRALGAYVAGMGVSLISVNVVRQLVYSLTAPPDLDPELALYVWDGFAGQSAVRQEFSGEQQTLAVLPFFAMSLWATLTDLPITAVLLAHAAAYTAIAYAWICCAWKAARGRSAPWGAAMIATLTAAGVVFRLGISQDEWVLASRPVTLIPACGALALAAVWWRRTTKRAVISPDALRVAE